MIPKIIWQTYKLPEGQLEEYMTDAIASWKYHNPEYEYRYMDDKQAEEFVLNEYGQEMYDLFIKCPIGVMRADMWRYLIIYKYGGVYTDLDTICRIPIDKWLKDEDRVYIAMEHELHYCQWTFAAEAGHPLFKTIIDLMVERLKTLDTNFEHFVHQSTGPGVFTDGILKFIEQENHHDLSNRSKIHAELPITKEYGIHIKPSRVFYNDYVVHLFGSTNWKDGTYDQWTKKKTVLMYSIVRNVENTVERMYNQMKQTVLENPQYNFLVSVYENDSGDRTKELLHSFDWSFAEHSIVTEDLDRPNFGSHPIEERVKNLAEARNKAIEAKDFLERSDYILMIEGDMRFEEGTISKVLDFPNIVPDFHIVSAVTFLDEEDHLWDTWATRNNSEHNRGHLIHNWQNTMYGKYYSTSNGACLYIAEPFKKGIRYGYINRVWNTFDCEMVVVCQNFHEAGYENIYIRHDARGYCFG